MSRELFRLIYCSRSAFTGSETELDRILLACRRNNRPVGITGALLYTHEMFAQTLEGPAPAVESTFARIQMDRRHREIVLLQAEAVQHRVFEGWSMALATPDDPADAVAVLGRALADAGNGGQEILGLLDLLVRRELEWLAAA